MKEIVRLQSAPIMFWSFITPDEWAQLPIYEQDILIKFALINIKTFDYRSTYESLWR